MKFIKPINVNKFSSAILSGQIKLQSGQYVQTDDRDPVLSVFVGTNGRYIHCIHGKDTRQALERYRAYKVHMSKLSRMLELKKELAAIEKELEY
jgi:hypothetical protein